VRSWSALSVALPREALAGAAEVAVGRGRLVDRAAQFKVAEDGAGAQVEVLLHQAAMASRETFSVPNVSISSESGLATPIA